MTSPGVRSTLPLQARYVLVGTASCGLYVGEWDGSDQQAIAEKAIRLKNARHVRYWYGKTGGITSLAAHGPCGPKGPESRIGAPAPSALITDVRNIFECTEEARRAFDAIQAR